MKHKHWIFIGYDIREGDRIEEPVEITVNDAQNEEEALLEAKNIVTRKFYILRKVYECTQCFYEDRKNQALLKIIKIENENN